MNFRASLRWITGLAIFAGLLVLLSGAIPQLNHITTVLDRVGFEAGRYRISLLTGLRVILTIIFLFLVVRITHKILRRYIRHTPQLDPTQRVLAEKLVGIALIVIAFFVGVDVLAIDLTALAVFSGALGLAIGFGLQKTFGNLIAGIILLMDRSIKPGDVIVVGESVGWVNRIGVRAVSIITRDGKEHLIPNENLMTQEVENWSFSDRNVRLHIPVCISYAMDQDHAQALMRQAAQAVPRVLHEPGVNVWLTALGDNGIEYEILAWIGDPENGLGNVKSEILNVLWKLFTEHNIEIPYPQRDVRMTLKHSD